MKPSSSPTAVVFDLDGTLIDSRRDLATAVNRAREELGFAPLPLAQVVALVGEGARRLVEKALEGEVQGSALDAALEAFYRHYWQLCLETTRPYPGVEPLLRRLEKRLPLAVLTNKPEAFSRRILEGLGLAGCFRRLLGGDSLPTRKPDPEGLRRLARELGVAVGRLLLVGDSGIDAATAQAAGCPFALAEWGFASPEERAALAADRRLTHPRELAAALLDGCIEQLRR